MHIGPILSKRRDSKFKKLISVFLIPLSFKRYTKFSKKSKINKHTDTDTDTDTDTYTYTYTHTHTHIHTHAHVHTYTHRHTHARAHARTHARTQTETQSSLYQYFLNQIKDNFLVSCFKNVLIKKCDSLDTFILNILPC